MGSFRGSTPLTAYCRTRNSIWAVGSFGRGYDPKELSGDHGVGFTGELQYTRAVDIPYMERYQLFGFYDAGKIWVRDLPPGLRDKDNATLASAGGGVRLWFAPDISMALQVAKPLNRDSQRSGGDREPQVLFRTTARF